MSWSPTQYSKFENERNRPIVDLLARVMTPDVKTAVDIGCGPGNSTEFLRGKYPKATISGMDSSAEMIEAAKKRMPETDFYVADIGTWEGDGTYDVILANAALQWVPDHAVLLPRLLGRLNKGGSLAVQTPDNLDEPAHRLMREVAANGPWAAKLKGAGHGQRQNAEWYYRTLREAGAEVDIWRTTYFHPLAGGPEAVVEWFKSTGLRPFLMPLDEGEKAAFLAAYTQEVAKAYPVLGDGTVVLPFPRLFYVATR